MNERKFIVKDPTVFWLPDQVVQVFGFVWLRVGGKVVESPLRCLMLLFLKTSSLMMPSVSASVPTPCPSAALLPQFCPAPVEPDSHLLNE